MLILHRLYYMIKKGAFQKNKLEDYELLSNMNSNLSLAKVKGTLKASLSPGWISCMARELLDTAGPTSEPELEHLISSEWGQCHVELLPEVSLLLSVLQALEL